MLVEEDRDFLSGIIELCCENHEILSRPMEKDSLEKLWKSNPFLCTAALSHPWTYCISNTGEAPPMEHPLLDLPMPIVLTNETCPEGYWFFDLYPLHEDTPWPKLAYRICLQHAFLRRWAIWKYTYANQVPMDEIWGYLEREGFFDLDPKNVIKQHCKALSWTMNYVHPPGSAEALVALRQGNQ
jgi:hypothetical protein